MPDPKDPEKINITPSLEEVTDAYREVVDHNEKYADIGAAFRNIINGVVTNTILASDKESEVKPADGEYPPIVVEGDMDAELQEMFHGNTFAHIGIKLFPIGGYTVKSFEGKRASSTELEPLVTNTQLYLEFLRQQTKEAVNHYDQNFRLMVDVLSTLKKVIKVSYVEGAKDQPGSELLTQNGEDALRTFIAIDEQYQRLGLDEPTHYAEYLQPPQSGFLDNAWRNRNKLKAEEYRETYQELRAYVHYWGRDVLLEYMTIGAPERLAMPKRWAANNTMDRLAEQVEYIAKLVGPERTTAFGLECAKAMVSGIEITLQSMNRDPDNWMNKIEGILGEFERNIKRLKALLD